MAASKVIDMEGLENAEEIQKLVKSIRRTHVKLNQMKDDFETEKKRLGEISKEIMSEDLKKDIPELNSNHEYHLDDGTVTVNFRMKMPPMTEINDEPAGKVLDRVFGEQREKLFETRTSIDILADEQTLLQQAPNHPECFDVGLKTLTYEQKMQLVQEHPDWVQLQVTDREKYAEIYPAHVNKVDTVTAVSKMIEKASKLSDIAKQQAAGFFRALLPKVVTPAIVCGNRNKKG